MKSQPESGIRVHVSRIDEFLASRLLEEGGSPLAFRVRDTDADGAISLVSIGHVQESPASEGIDFELSACECSGLGSEDPGIYIGRDVYTSSAYEFFDFLLGHYSSFDCYIEFTGNAWKVRVENAVNNVR